MYTIKSVSGEGVFYLVKDWNNHKMIWAEQMLMDKKMTVFPYFKTERGAKTALNRLLKVMTEYINDEFFLVYYDGNELKELKPVTVKIENKKIHIV